MGESRGRAGRGQATTIGLVLAFGLMIAGAVVVVTLGASAIGDSKEDLSEQRAEKAMTQFDSKAALVALGNTDVQQVSLGGDGSTSFEVHDDAGWLMIRIENRTSGTETTLLNESLGSITHEVNDNTLAYQGGGVWKTGGDNESVMVSPPEFHFRNGTLTLPVVNVSGASTLSGRASIRHTETVRKYPNESLSSLTGTNPLVDHRVKVVVKSDYYKGWGEYFETRTDGEVEYDHDRKLANLTLKSPIGLRTVSNAMTATTSSGTLSISGTAGSACGSRDDYVDSYNSSIGTYCGQSQQSDGNITYGGDFDISGRGGGSPFKGTLRSGGEIEFSSNPRQGKVDGDILHTDGCTANRGRDTCQDYLDNPATDEVRTINGVDTVSPITSAVRDEVADVNESNNNGGAGIPINSNDRLTSSSATLPAGEYHLDRIDLGNGDSLELDTSGGDVTVAVDESVDVDRGSITVTGDNQAYIYVNGSATVAGTYHFRVKNGGEVRTPNDNTTQLRVYGKESFKMDVTGGSTSVFQGAVYAPVGSSGSGEVSIDHANFYGGAVTGDTTIGTQGFLHYDEALSDTPVIAPGTKVVKITYLHVSVNRIRVS